ncbi:hypothetical protein HK103_002038 [Boothiomyces macroporosus]|uniref:Uncharacterized protein n=1 Tax=Boothiomyces macroporosus TaxID=261099 RepID=A0AAD5UAL7_9FUNG|nr:hypothetical protein HK103_002038 [Boothiomyces macroporosus]
MKNFTLMRVSTVSALYTILNSVSASAPIPVSSYWTDFPIDVGNDQKASVAVFKIDFDQPLYLTSTSANVSVPLTSFGLTVNTTTNFPMLTMLAQGSIAMTCSGNGSPVNISNFFPPGQMNGPPPNLMVAPPTGDPGSTIVNAVVGGVKVNETFFPSRLGVAVVVNGGNAQSVLGSSCVITGLTTGQYMITSANGTPWTTPLNVTWQKPRCVLAEVNALVALAQAISDYGKDISTLDQLDSINNMVSVLNTREAFYGCQNLVYSFATIGTVNFTITGTTDCVYPPSDPRWSTDPCCNPVVALTQCCAPKSITAYAPVLTGINATAITSVCHSPGKISALMSDFAQAQARIALLSNINVDSLWNTYSGTLNECQKAVYETQYGIYLLTKADEMKTELLHVAGLAKTGIFAVDGINFYNYIGSLGLVYDCVGPSSWNYRRSYQQEGTDENGNPLYVIAPADQAGCLTDKQCTLEPWTRQTLQQCLADNLTGFCGQTDGNFAQPISRFAQCQINYQDVQQSGCAALNGTLTFDNTCLYPSRNSSALCLTGPTCQASQMGNPWACIGSVCYNSTVTSSQNCSSLPNMYWDSDRSICAASNMMSQSSCISSSLTYVPGVYFSYGYYDSPAKCPNSTCADFEDSTLYSDPVNYLTRATNQDCNSQGQYGCSTTTFANALGCTWNPMTKCINSAQCLASGTCNDYEYGNGQSNGVCVYKPATPGLCTGGDFNTRTGNCISRNITSIANCTSANATWTTRATSKAACDAYGGYCIEQNGDMAYLNQSSCAACGGEYYTFYQWQDPQWSPTEMKNTQWIPVQYAPQNQYIQVVDDSLAQQYFQNAIGRIISRKYVNQLNVKFRTYGAIYQAVACDCTPGQYSCFSTPVSSPIDSCLADPRSNSTCSGVVIPNGLFNTSKPISISVNYVSSSAFVSSNLPTLVKRTTSSSSVAVIKDSFGNIVGQLVGNGQQYTFSQMPTGSISICLSLDLSISQNSTLYPVPDFVNMTNNALGVPLNISVTSNGNQYCGSVPAFMTGTFYPILRMVSRASVGATTTVPSVTSTGITYGNNATGTMTGVSPTRSTVPSATLKSSFSLSLVLLLASNNYFKVQVKQFKTQHRNSNIAAEDIELSINSLTNFKEKLFEYTQQKIQRLVTIEGEEYSIAEFDPTIEQLARFAKIRRNQHDYEIDNLTWDILTNWSRNPPYPELSILRFGDHVTNKVRYAKVQTLFYAPAEVDNSGAPSNAVIDKIAAELKRVHSNHFRAMDIVWRIWATDISRKPTHMHPELIRATPPIELMRLFDLATPNERQWNHFNNANRTAQQVVGDLNERATLTLSDLETFETKFIYSIPTKNFRGK